MCGWTAALAGLSAGAAFGDPALGSEAAILLDRGWGKAPQPHTGEDDKEIRITVRNITESRS